MAFLPHQFSQVLFLFFVATFLLETNADEALVDGICKQTQDYNFCKSSLYSDPRTIKANLDDLATISTALTLNQIRETSNRIPSIASGINDPVGKNRIGICQSEYKSAISNFQAAFESSSRRSYYDVINQVTVGTNQIIDCENIYRKEEPIGVSPVSEDNRKVIKLSEIIFIVVDGLLPH